MTSQSYLDSDCSSYDKLDSFYLSFSKKAKIGIKKKNWLFKNEEKNICGTYFLQSSMSNLTVLGLTALDGQYIIFDLENNLLAFYPLSNHTYNKSDESSSLVLSSSVNSENGTIDEASMNTRTVLGIVAGIVIAVVLIVVVIVLVVVLIFYLIKRKKSKALKVVDKN